ncbi:MAG: hypothetical protein QM724_03655 [Flavobacteriales bacterium]
MKIQNSMLAIALALLTSCGQQFATPEATREYRGERQGKSASICFAANGKWAMINNDKDFDNDARMGDYIELEDRFVISGGSQGEAAVIRKQGNAIHMEFRGNEITLQRVK